MIAKESYDDSEWIYTVAGKARKKQGPENIGESYIWVLA
jgi:hypothetical protein